MRKNNSYSWSTSFLLTIAAALTITAEPVHQLTGIQVNPDHTIVLEADGSVAATNVYKNFFDLVPIQASTSFQNWTTVATLLRTNLTTNAVSLSEALPIESSVQFFRTSPIQFHTPFRKPTGNFSVGTTTRLVTDASRTNRFGYKTNSSFMLTFWYPAVTQFDGIPALYQHPLIASNRNYWSGQIVRIPGFVSHAITDVAMHGDAGLTFPVIIYSHGLATDSGRGVRTENTGRALELSSHGYIIVSLDHNDTFGTVFPGDNFILGKATDAFANQVVSHTNRLRDINFVLDHLGAMNSSDPLLAGRLDLNRVGMMGWSFGGGVSADSLRLNNRIAAAVLLDGYLAAAPDLLKAGVQKPLLAMCSPTSGLYEDNSTLFNKASKDIYLLQIKNAAHEDFTDAEWVASPSAASRGRAIAMDACAVSFFNKYLRGIDDQLLENPRTSFSEITSFKKK